MVVFHVGLISGLWVILLSVQPEILFAAIAHHFSAPLLFFDVHNLICSAC